MSEEDAPRDWMRAQMALDGELDAANQLAFEQDVARDPALAEAYARLGALRERVRAQAPRERAPERLRATLEALAAPAARPSRRVAWSSLAAALALVAALAGYGAGRRPGDPTFAALVAGYERAALSGQPVDVASSDRHTVKPWLAARAPFGALAPDLADAGYPLIGGRIDIVDRRPTPTMVYRRREHLLSVSELPLGEGRNAPTALDGYNLASWSDSERDYVAVSDIEAPELAEFIALFRERAAR